MVCEIAFGISLFTLIVAVWNIYTAIRTEREDKELQEELTSIINRYTRRSDDHASN